MNTPNVTFQPVAFTELPGWAQDDHLAALQTMRRSCGPVIENAGDARVPVAPQLLAVCEAARALPEAAMTAASARAFFETNFRPHKVVHADSVGLLTGYYEPVIEGSRTRTDKFNVPVLRRPPDLVNLVAESQRAAMAHALTHARQTANGQEPYATRAEIEGGALDGQGLELLYLADPVDSFFMHIQGSGRIRFADGSMVRVTYHGKNGHPYTSVGRYLIDAGLFPADQMSLDALKVWLRADPKAGAMAMHQNKSYVFFRELDSEQFNGPLGVLEIPLSEGRSLAVDTRYHATGTPVYVAAPELTHATSAGGFHRLMIAQDVGSAIRGPERGDIYFGSGDAAGKLAGVTKHRGNFFALLPRAVP
jgi:membrane-bound lytic murein transglycosylase A